MLLTCYFLCSVFIMSQASASIALTTIPPVTVVCSSTSSLLTTVTMAPSLMGLPVTSGQHNVVLPQPLTLRNNGGVIGLASVPQPQAQSQKPVQSYANYAMGPLQVGFSFRVEPPTISFICVGFLLWCMFSTFRCHAGCFTNLWGLNHCSPMKSTHGRHMCNLVIAIGRHQECTAWLLTPLPCGRGSHLLLNQLSSSHSNYMVGHTGLGAWQSHPISPAFLHGGEGSYVPGLVPFNDKCESESEVGIKPGYSHVVIGYQVDEFTHTWSAE